MDGDQHVKWKVGGEETRVRVLGILQYPYYFCHNFQFPERQTEVMASISTMNPLTNVP